MKRSVNPYRNLELRTMTKSMVIVMFAVLVATQCIFLFSLAGTMRSLRLKTLEDRAAQLQSQTDVVIRDIASNANMVAYGVTAEQFSQARKQREKISAYKQLGLMMEAVSFANPNIEHLFLTDFDIVFVGDIVGDVLLLRRRIGQHLEQQGWPERQSYFTMDMDGQYALLCVTPSYLRHGRQTYAVVSFVLSERMLWPAEQADSKGQIFLLSAADEVLYQNASLDKAQLAPFLQNTALQGGQTASWEAQGYFAVLSATNAQLGSRWLCMTHSGISARDLSNVLQFVLLTDLAMLALMILFIKAFNAGITKPLSGLVSFVDEVRDNGCVGRIAITSRNEIGQMGLQINRLLDGVERINRERRQAQRRLYELEIIQKQTELSALYSQVNPHFLYNTLDCMRSIAMVHEMPEVEEIATSLSDILRYSIKGSDFVCLDEELACIRQYIGIMQIRHKNRFLVQIDVDETLLDARIPRMILQPIVENAVFHGLEPIRQGPKLSIRGFCEGTDEMWLEVRDNGLGMAGETLAGLRACVADANRFAGTTDGYSGIGLANIAQRIRLVFGEAYGMRIESAPHVGTCVGLRLPVRREIQNP
ncbi:MAG TPA: sensor histidine kinase [Clostridia bacterium]|nr:sensor histidine kinase [Clostridia bacterium]